MEIIDKTKAHIIKHKVLYSCLATGAGVAGITYLIMRGRYEGFRGEPYGLQTADTVVTMRPLCFFSNQKNSVRVINRHGIGRPGYLVHSLDTDEYFSSQREAANMFGISEALLSKHLSGKLENAEGHTFERLNFAA